MMIDNEMNLVNNCINMKIELKLCTQCNINKPLSDFYFRKELNKYRNICKLCYHNYNYNFYVKNSDIIKKQTKTYKTNHSIEYKNYFRNYMSERLANDIEFKLLHRYRKCVWNALNYKTETTIEMLGCTPQEFNKHLKKYFQTGMTEDNYGTGVGKWQVDHRIPLSFFNLNDLTEQKQAFYYANCQPLWFEENMAKGDKILLKYASYLENII